MTQDTYIRELEQQLRRTTRRALILLALLVVVLIAGGVYGYLRLRSLLEPQQLVARAERQLQADAPQIRRALKEKVGEAGPALARKASHKALAQMPEARERLGDFLEQQIDAGLDRQAAVMEREFRRFLRENRPTLKKGFDRLRNAPEETERLAGELEKAVDERLGTDIRKDARAVLDLLRHLNDKLEKLAAGKDLNPGEQLELRMVRTLRAFQEQAVAEVERRR